MGCVQGILRKVSGPAPVGRATNIVASKGFGGRRWQWRDATPDRSVQHGLAEALGCAGCVFKPQTLKPQANPKPWTTWHRHGGSTVQGGRTHLAPAAPLLAALALRLAGRSR